MVNEWLTERLQQSLSPYQLTCLSFMVKVVKLEEMLNPIRIHSFQKIYSDFELLGIDEEQLNSKAHQSIQRRLQLEETNSALNDSASRIHSSGPGRGLGGLTNQLGQSGSALFVFPFHYSTPLSPSSHCRLSSSAASQAVSMVEGAGAKLFTMFK